MCYVVVMLTVALYRALLRSAITLSLYQATFVGCGTYAIINNHLRTINLAICMFHNRSNIEHSTSL